MFVNGCKPEPLNVEPWTYSKQPREHTLDFKSLNQEHINMFKSMVSADRFSTGVSVLDLHAKDQSLHPPRRPEAVMWPSDTSEVVAILKYANEHAIPVTGWGAGSSTEGNPIPVRGGVVLDFLAVQ